MGSNAAGAGLSRLLAKARELRRRGLHEEALTLYRRALAAAPGDERLHQAACETWVQLGRYPEALQAAQAGARARPSSAHFRFMTGHLLAKLGRPEQAIGRLRQAVQRDPSRAHYHAELGRLLSTQGRHGRALAAYERAAELSPEDAALAARAAELRLWLGDYPGALAGSERALKLEPSARARHLRGGALVMLGRCQEALSDLDAALALERPSMTSYERYMPVIWKGEALRRLGRSAEAVRHFRRAEIPMRLFSVSANLALALIAQGSKAYEREWRDLQEGGRAFLAGRKPAARALEEALARLRGRRFDRLYDRKNAVKTLCEDARAELSRGDVDAVLAKIRAVFRRFPGDPHVHAYLGEVRLWAGRCEEARKDFRRALSANRRGPRYVPWARIGLAASCALLGDLEEALRWCEAARKLGSRAPTLSIWEAEAYRRMGKPRRALAALGPVLEAAGRRPGVLAARGLLAFDLGRKAEARTAFDAVALEAHNLAADAARLVLSRASASGDELRRAVLSESLDLMRGNRSAFVPTYFLPSGELRLIEAFRPVP